jgi:r-opsin
MLILCLSYFITSKTHVCLKYLKTKSLMTGVAAILTMVVIGYDRYNVIVKGFTGKKITPTIAFLSIVFIWAYACACCCPPFLGWGGYALEGLFMTCSFDYLSDDWNRKSFVLYAFICNYCFPISLVIFFYSQIVKAVVAHESALKAQAKKMNVDSLRSNQVRGHP